MERLAFVCAARAYICDRYGLFDPLNNSDDIKAQSTGDRSRGYLAEGGKPGRGAGLPEKSTPRLIAGVGDGGAG